MLPVAAFSDPPSFFVVVLRVLFADAIEEVIMKLVRFILFLASVHTIISLPERKMVIFQDMFIPSHLY